MKSYRNLKGLYPWILTVGIWGIQPAVFSSYTTYVIPTLSISKMKSLV